MGLSDFFSLFLDLFLPCSLPPLSLPPSLFLPVPPSIPLSLRPSVRPSICPSLYSSLPPSLPPFLTFSFTYPLSRPLSLGEEKGFLLQGSPFFLTPLHPFFPLPYRSPSPSFTPSLRPLFLSLLLFFPASTEDQAQLLTVTQQPRRCLHSAGKSSTTHGLGVQGGQAISSHLIISDTFPSCHFSSHLILLQGKMDLALQMIQAAILANPAYAEAYNNLGKSPGALSVWRDLQNTRRLRCPLFSSVVAARSCSRDRVSLLGRHWHGIQEPCSCRCSIQCHGVKPEGASRRFVNSSQC